MKSCTMGLRKVKLLRHLYRSNMFKTEIGSESVKIKDEPPSRSSPDSSTDPWSCPQCGRPHENESVLLEHLLNDHQIRVVPPQSPSTTRCPVCRKHVADLSQHFALEHGESNQDVKHQLASVPNGATRIIPIVLPSQPGKIANSGYYFRSINYGALGAIQGALGAL